MYGLASYGSISYGGRIIDLFESFISARARIIRFDEIKTIQARGRIQKAGIESIQSKARIKRVGIAQTIQAKALIRDPDAGFINLRSYEQKYPLSLNDDQINNLRSNEQDYPLSLDEDRLL